MAFFLRFEGDGNSSLSSAAQQLRCRSQCLRNSRSRCGDLVC